MTLRLTICEGFMGYPFYIINMLRSMQSKPNSIHIQFLQKQKPNHLVLANKCKIISLYYRKLTTMSFYGLFLFVTSSIHFRNNNIGKYVKWISWQLFILTNIHFHKKLIFHDNDEEHLNVIWMDIKCTLCGIYYLFMIGYAGII